MPDDPTPLEDRINALQRDLDASRQTIDHLERRQRIDALLAGSDTVDLEAARLLTEAAVAGMDEPDLAAAVADLKRHKPYLFHPRPRSEPRPRDEASAMSAAVEDEDDTAARAAAEAAATGDRRDLLRYLRLRRAAT